MWKAEAGGLLPVQSQPGLHIKFQTDGLEGEPTIYFKINNSNARKGGEGGELRMTGTIVPNLNYFSLFCYFGQKVDVEVN